MAILGTHSNTELYQHLEWHTLNFRGPLLTSGTRANPIIGYHKMSKSTKKHQSAVERDLSFHTSTEKSLAIKLKLHHGISKGTRSPSFPP